MKLLRYGPARSEKPRLLDGELMRLGSEGSGVQTQKVVAQG